MPGTRAEGTAKFIGRPRPGCENLFNNSFKRTRSAKTGGEFFTGYETFQVKFEECHLYYNIFVNSNI